VNAEMNDCIDFVVLWVDDSDPAWQAKKARYTGATVKEGNSVARYRDWDTLKYWFRGVEKFAPWVRHVYFVTDDQKPEWLNTDHPKLKWVKHTDFIPAEYLPVFSSHPIEWNLHRIEGLSENFVYFNDDMFLVGKTRPEDFFVNGKPCDFPVIGVQYACGFFSHMLFNNAELINRNFSFRSSIQQNLWKWIKGQPLSGLLKLLLYGRRDLMPGTTAHHIHISYKKETYHTLWEKEQEAIHRTCQNRLRSKEDVTPWCMRDWQIFSGNFYPQRPIGKLFHTATLAYSDEAIQYMRKQKGKVICLNDTEDEQNFELHKRMVLEEFERLLPEKSGFEL